MIRKIVNPFLDIPDMKIINQHFGSVPSWRTGLIAEYLFDNNLLDTSGNGRNFSNVGSISYVNDRQAVANKALSAYGSYLTRAGFFNGLTNFTVSFWYYKNATG